MVDERRRGVDPLEAAPRPATFAQRRVIAFVGALLLLAAAGLLIVALGTGATPVSPADEMNAARGLQAAGDRR